MTTSSELTRLLSEVLSDPERYPLPADLREAAVNALLTGNHRHDKALYHRHFILSPFESLQEAVCELVVRGRPARLRYFIRSNGSQTQP